VKYHELPAIIGDLISVLSMNVVWMYHGSGGIFSKLASSDALIESSSSCLDKTDLDSLVQTLISFFHHFRYVTPVTNKSSSKSFSQLLMVILSYILTARFVVVMSLTSIVGFAYLLNSAATIMSAVCSNLTRPSSTYLTRFLFAVIDAASWYVLKMRQFHEILLSNITKFTISSVFFVKSILTMSPP